MSDTVKLIIEIPNWKYKSICDGVEASKKCGVVGIDPNIHEAIYKGTPLDNVKAEIREQQKEYQEWGWAYDDVLEILDNIG